jgi:hypothetical protein
MAVGIELEQVRRKTGGRVHLTPHVPDSGPVVTLCGQTFAEGTYEATSAEADCRNCLRRRDDPARVSSAFFQSDVGAELLQRSLEQARARQREERRSAPAPAPTPSVSAEGGRAAPRHPAPRPGPTRAEPPQPEVRELRSRVVLRPTFPNVYLSPDGVILRVSGGGVEHVTFNGPIDVRQRDRVLTIRVGDLVLEFDVG